MAQMKEFFDEITKYRTRATVNARQGHQHSGRCWRGLVEKRKSVSLGNNLRLESKKFIGAGLEFGYQVIQFTT